MCTADNERSDVLSALGMVQYVQQNNDAAKSFLFERYKVLCSAKKEYFKKYAKNKQAISECYFPFATFKLILIFLTALGGAKNDVF